MVAKKNVVGLKLITLKDGKEVGKVKDVIFDPKKNKVKALKADDGGLLGPAKVVLLPEVHSIGEDAVTIESEENMKPLDEVKEPIASIEKLSQKVSDTTLVTTEGKELGNIDDLYFDPETGNVEEYEVSQPNQKGGKSKKKRIIVPEVVTVGEDVTVVSGYGENVFPHLDSRKQEENKEKTSSTQRMKSHEENSTAKQKEQKMANSQMGDKHSLQELQKQNQSSAQTQESPQQKTAKPSTQENAAQVKEQTKTAGKGILSTFSDWLVGPTIQEAISQITGIPRKMPVSSSGAQSGAGSPAQNQKNPPTPASPPSAYQPVGVLGGKSTYEVPDGSTLVVPEEKK